MLHVYLVLQETIIFSIGSISDSSHYYYFFQNYFKALLGPFPFHTHLRIMSKSLCLQKTLQGF